MQKANVNGFVLSGSDFEFTLSDGRRICILFSSKDGSISNNVRRINKKLLSELKDKIDLHLLNLMLSDIEDELISCRDKIFGFVNGNSESSNDADISIDVEDATAKSKFLEDITKIRKQFSEQTNPYRQWQSCVEEKYDKLRLVTMKHYPEAWPLLEFCLSVKSIMNIEGVTLPFMGVLLAAPASMKTMIIQLFRKYPNSFYSDSFTPNSLVSHNSALNEEQLQKIDMLPKMKDKVVLTPELAPIFTAKEDEIQKILGMITRILDGHGFENDSGAHGHRRYGDTMFAWIGAGVEIPYRVWKVLGTLGHKIYFFRPDIREKTVDQLKEIAKSNDFGAKFKEIEDALLEYLKTFDGAPDTEQISKDKSGKIIKVKWNEKDKGGLQDKVIGCIAEISKLLACLRGTVYVSEAKSVRKRDSGNSDDNSKISVQDYDTALPIIEDPSRAVTLLRNLAIGHAISQGRDSLRLEDVPIAIKVALSTAMYSRIKIFDLLLKKKGELTTSDITEGLRISEPTARRTMREFHALKIADISPVSGYAKAELKITLRSEYDWFKTEEFKHLRDGFFPDNDENATAGRSNTYHNDTTDSSNQHQDSNRSDTYDNEDCHTSKVNPPPDTDEKNNSNGCDSDQHEVASENLKNSNTVDVRTSPENNYDNNQQYIPGNNNGKDSINITEKNNACVWDSNLLLSTSPSNSTAWR
jgi:hypothetical protein